MDKIYVVFWTQGGNTQAMAEAIGEGIREAGKEAEVVFVTGANLDELKAAPKFALGCPAMGAEVLEESEMEPFVCDVEGFASGKKIALFGSYGWGDGEWIMRVHSLRFWMPFISKCPSMSVMSFGKSRAKMMGDGKVKVAFSDVAGADEAKQE